MGQITRVEFISQDYLKQNSPIQFDIDGSLLRPIVLTSTDRYILPIIGSPLYDYLQNQITANTLSAQYKTLMDRYIQPTLTQFVVYESLPFISFKLTNKNVSKNSGDNSEPVDLEELKLLSERVWANATFYAERMTRYLMANQSLFPEYYQLTGNLDTYPPQPSQYFSGLHIPGIIPEQIGDYSLWTRYYNLINNIGN